MTVETTMLNPKDFEHGEPVRQNDDPSILDRLKRDVEEAFDRAEAQLNEAVRKGDHDANRLATTLEQARIGVGKEMLALWP